MKKIWDIFFPILVILLVIGSFIYHQQLSFYLFPHNEDRIGELTKLILSVLGGFCIFYGLIISNRRASTTEKSVQQQSEQIELARKSQIDERFKNAIEHLGSDKEPIILGGISTLAQIAKEDKSKYAEVVFNILNSYIRSETNIYKKTANDYNSTSINTIINYLYKIKESNPFIKLKADLSSSNLAGQNIESCDFTGANLSFTLLGGISDSVFDECNLSKAKIQSSFFKNNSLKGIDVFDTLFMFVEFEGGKFKSSLIDLNSKAIMAHFVHCKFIGFIFDERDIYNSVFIGCIFDNCTFNNLSLMKTKIVLSNLNNCNFSNASISNIDFRGTVFNNTQLNDIVFESNFNGCRKDSFDNIYIDIDSYIERSISGSDRIDESLFTNTVLKDCTFDVFTDSDALELKQLKEEISKTEKLPIGRKDN